MSAPLAIDLCCGLGGWTEGLLAEGFEVIGFDNERHEYGDERYPAQLVLQDVLTLHGSQFRDADLIVASPPCQKYSYMAMPWSLAKKMAAEYRDGTRDIEDLNRLFNACFRIQDEACEAGGRHIPLIVENVRGAQEWVGRARWNFGSFYLWGDVPALMPPVASRSPMKNGIAHRPGGATNFHRELDNGRKQVPHNPQGHWTNPAEANGVKQGGDGFNSEQPSISRRTGSKSPARKAASARIAKIPLPLSRHIAAMHKPQEVRVA